ncbi:MAG TPA: TIM-barrel domain-containing protein [Rubricoccaceae bacterium]|jgi:alpha-glucosidase
MALPAVDRRRAALPDPAGFTALGAVVRIERPQDGSAVLVCDGGARLRLDALADDTLRIRLAPPGPGGKPGAFAGDDSYARDPAAEWAGPQQWTVRVGADGIRFETAALAVEVTRDACRVRVLDRAGRVVFDEAGGSAWHPDGRRAHTVRLGEADRLLGLGDKPLPVDRRGHSVDMWNTDAFRFGPGTDPLYKSVPFVLRLGERSAVGLFYDSPRRTTLDLGATDAGTLRFEQPAGELDLYVLTAATPVGVVQAYARLTGCTPMLPRWALGYHQCRYSYMDAAEVRDVAREFRARRIPCDTLYFDIHYMDGFRVFTWDPAAFQDPTGLVGDLARDGFRSVVIVDPGVKADDPAYGVFHEGEAIDAYVRYPDRDGQPGPVALGEVWPGTCAFPDFTRPDVRAWWGGLHDGLVRTGVAGIWNDMNEPALFSVAHVEGTMDAEHAVGTLPDDVRHAFEAPRGTPTGGTHAEAHNVYGMQMQRATYDGLRTLQPDTRPFTITRAAYAGAQRYGTGWTGDNTASWGHLVLAVQQTLSLGASGMPFVGADVGGFIDAPSGELLARWTQVGALTPLFRNHSAVDTPRQEPWLFGPEVERVCREAIELRYRLLPILYTALWQAATEGTPMLRALALVWPDDETIARTSPLGFTVGDAILAQPVVVEGQTEREVYLPASGGGWYDLQTGEHLDGRQTVWTQTPLDRIPLYARGGSVVALGPVRQHTGEPARTLDVHAYVAAGRHESVLYDDAGDGWAFRDGAFWLGRFTLDATPERVTLTCAVDGHYVPEWEHWTVAVHGLGRAPAAVTVDGALTDTVWDGRVLRVQTPVGASVHVER